MASLVKYPGSKFWFAAFRDARGRQRRQTTRELDRKRAQAVADQFERVAQRKGNPQRVREAFADFYREHYAEDLPNASVAVFARRWLESRKAETAPASYARYEKTIEKFLNFLGAQAERDLAEITKKTIAAFRDAQAARNAAATANLDLKIVRMLFRAARLDGYLFQDPAEAVKVLKNNAPDRRRPFTVKELRAILAVADTEWQSLIKFGLYTGQRLADLATLSWTQIDLEHDEIRLKTRKTGKRLVLPIAGPLREHLLSLAASDKPGSPVHPRSAGIVKAQHGRVGTLSNQFADLLVSTGLRAPRTHQSTGKGRDSRREGMDVSFHSLRHTSASLLKSAGIPDAVVMELIGHESAAVSRRYTHVGKEALAKAAGALPEL